LGFSSKKETLEPVAKRLLKYLPMTGFWIFGPTIKEISKK